MNDAFIEVPSSNEEISQPFAPATVNDKENTGSSRQPPTNNASSSIILPAKETQVPLRRSSRHHQKPGLLQDYHYNLVRGIHSNTDNTPYPLYSYLSYDKLSPSHKAFVLNVSTIFEPTYYHQANKFSHW